MKALVLLLAFLCGGFAVGWLASPGPFRHHFRASRQIELFDSQGNHLGTIPAGSPVLSDSRLVHSVDLGWWGYVPVYFSTMAEAQTLGVVPGGKVLSIMDIKLNADAKQPIAAPQPAAPGREGSGETPGKRPGA